MALAVGDDGAGECGDGLGQLDGNTSEVEAYVVGADLDVADGHAADRCCSLGVEEDEQAGEAVFCFEVVVM